MNYIIYDLEFNQEYPSNKSVKTDNYFKLPFEIIQIGAVKLNKNFKIISKFNALVKPTLYTTIHPYIEDLTKINNEQLNSSNSFPKVFEDFVKFIGKNDPVLCVWNTTDIKELIRNIEFHKLQPSLIPKQYIDIQAYASKYFNAPKGSKIGLRNAIEILKIPIESEFHNAFNDAYYTSKVFKSIYNPDMKPIKYIPPRPKRNNLSKEKLDTVALINQFEKIYNRKMSEEEISIIKLAYIMGKTHQFTIKDQAPTKKLPSN